MSNRVVYFCGEFVPESEARVSIFDSSLMFGDMAFEMTRTFGHKPFRLRGHLERLYASLRLLEIDCEMTIDEMEALTLETLDKNKTTETDDVDWQIMHDVSRGPLPVYRSVFPDGIRPTVSINCWPLISHMGNFSSLYQSGVHLVHVSQQALPAHLVDPKAKTRSRLHYQMAVLQAGRSTVPGTDSKATAWPVLIDPDGFLAEGPGWNIFLVKEREILTPEPRNILRGVTRGATIELARGQGFQVREANLGRYELLEADEVFCTSTTYCMVHAATYEGQQIGDGKPGPVFARLLGAWKDAVGIDFVQQAEGYHERLLDWEKDQG